MKQQIATYFREYRENFRQKPFQTAAVLILQILFLLGWGLFFYYLYRLYASFIIPGRTEPKGNIYTDTLYALILITVYPYCFYKLSKILFAVQASFKLKLLGIFAAVICALMVPVLFISIRSLFSFLPDTTIAFWAK